MENYDDYGYKQPPEMGNKKIISIIAVIIVAVGLFFIINRFVNPKKEAPTLQEIQKNELDKLRAEVSPLTPEEREQQKKELDKLRKEVKPLSTEERQQQKKELDKLRAQYVESL